MQTSRNDRLRFRYARFFKRKHRRMSFVTWIVILLLTCTSSAIISQNDLAFWTLLKEYHEMDLPSQALGPGKESASPPVPVRVSSATAEATGPVPDDVALRLLVELTSEPVRLRVRCAHGCQRVRRPCDLFITPGRPLRMICYAMLPQCMHYGHTTINCGVYFTKRWPEVIQALCTMDYHTSESICALFARAAGSEAEAAAEIEKPFRLMLESLGVRLRPANATGAAACASPGPPARASLDERVSWLLAAGGLLAVLLGAFLVLRFDLAYWTPCSSFSWFDYYEVIRANSSVADGGHINVIGNAITFDSSDPEQIFEIRRGDSSETDASASSSNYKMVVVIVDGMAAHNVEFPLAAPTSYSSTDDDERRMIDAPPSIIHASAPAYNSLNAHVFPTGIIKTGEVPQPMPLTLSECSTSATRNALHCSNASYLQDCTFESRSTLNVNSAIFEMPLPITSVETLKNQNKLVSSHTPTTTENELPLVPLPYSTASVSEIICTSSTDSYQDTTTQGESFKSLSSHCTSLYKPAALPSQEDASTLLTSPCPAVASDQSSPSSNVPATQTVPQQGEPLHSSASQYPVPTAHPAAWIYPMIFPHPMPSSYSGTPISSMITPGSDTATSEMGSSPTTGGYVASSYPIPAAFPSPVPYPSAHAYFENGSCQETVVYPATQAYADAQVYPDTTACLPTTVYPAVTLAYPALPIYSPPTVHSRVAAMTSNEFSYKYPEELTHSTNQAVSSTAHFDSSARTDNPGHQMPDLRRTANVSTISICPSVPLNYNTEICPTTSDYEENRPYSETSGRQMYERPADSYITTGVPMNTASMLPARCYPTTSTYPMMSECRTNQTIQGHTPGSLYQIAPTNQQAVTNQQILSNRPANHRSSSNQPTFFNHRLLSTKRHPTNQRNSNNHRPFVNQKFTGYQRPPPNQRHPVHYRPTDNTRSSDDQRSQSQRLSIPPQAITHRLRPAHVSPAFQPAENCLSAATNQSTHIFQPVAPHQQGVTYHPITALQPGRIYQPAPMYQLTNTYQPLNTNQLAADYQPVTVCQEAPTYQQADVYHSEITSQPETTPESATQSATAYQSTVMYIPETHQPPYQTAVFQATPAYHHTAAVLPTSACQQASAYNTPPAFQQASANTVLVYQPTPTHSVSDHRQGPTNEQASGYLQPSNCQTTPLYQSASHAPPLMPVCSQSPANQMITTSFCHSEQSPTFVDNSTMGICTNSVGSQTYLGTSTSSQALRTELPRNENGCYSELTRGHTTSSDTQGCTYSNNCGYPIISEHRTIQMCPVRPDCPEMFTFPPRALFPAHATNMESITSPLHFGPGNSAETDTNSSQWTNGPMCELPNNTQTHQLVNEQPQYSFPNFIQFNGPEFQETTPVYNSTGLVRYDCNPHQPTQTYIVPPSENFEYYPHGAEQSAEAGEADSNYVPPGSYISGTECCMYQEQPPNIRDEPPQGCTEREVGDGDSHRIQFYEQPPCQERDEPCYATGCEARTENRCPGCQATSGVYDCDVNTMPKQFCYECCRSGYGNTCYEQWSCPNGSINPVQAEENRMTRDISNDISHNFSRLTVHDPDDRAGYYQLHSSQQQND